MPWITEEKKAVGGVGLTEEGVPVPGPEPEVPPVTPAPPPGVGLRPAEVKERPEGFYEEHQLLKKAIDKKGYSYKCVTPQELSDSTNIDLETVKLHLEIMQLDEAGKYVQGKSNDNPAFCSIDALQRLVENLRKLKV